MKIVPVYNELSKNLFAFVFPEMIALTPDISIRSGALKVGRALDLLGISTDSVLAESGEHDSTDTIDQRDFVIDRLFYKVAGSDEILEFDPSIFPPIKLRTSNVSERIIRAEYDFDPGVEVRGVKAPVIQFRASLDLQMARLFVTASANPVVEVIGYTVDGNRYNPNHRARPSHSVMDYVPTTIDDLGAGLTVYRDRHGADPIHLTDIGFEAKTGTSRPGHRWVVLNDQYLFKISGNHVVEGLWSRKTTP